MRSSEQVPITITLSPTQVDHVVHAASGSRAPGISTLIADTLGAPPAGEHGPRRSRTAPLADSADPGLSRSLLRGLSLLTCLGSDGTARGIVELARDAGMSPSTAHRYASTLVELGLLERCPKNRKYRLPVP